MRPSCSDTMANVRHMTEEEGKRSGRIPERSGLLRSASRNILGLASMPRGSDNRRHRRGELLGSLRRNEPFVPQHGGERVPYGIVAIGTFTVRASRGGLYLGATWCLRDLHEDDNKR
jgi:hypothetical protein